MNTEDRVRTHLEGASSTLQARDNLEAIIEQGRRRRRRNLAGSLLGAAAALSAFVLVGQALDNRWTQATVASDPSAEPAPTTSGSFPTTSPPVSTTQPAETGLSGVLIAGPDGIEVVDRESGEVTASFRSHPAYAEISVAYPDQTGGILFQHATTPLPWPNGALLQLGAGSSRPVVVATAPEGGRLVPVGLLGSPEAPKFAYLTDAPGANGLETRLHVIDLMAGASTDLGPIPPYTDVSTGPGDLISLVDRTDSECPTHRLVDSRGNERPSHLPDCLPVAAGVAVNNGVIGMLTPDGVLSLTTETGEELAPISVPGAYMVAGGPGGWVFRTPTETVAVDHARRQTSLDPVERGSAVPFSGELDLADGASLAPADMELPCSRVGSQLPSQDLPVEVAATREAIHAAAASCDYETLSALALADATTLTFGGGTDPIAVWVGEGVSGEDPLGLMARLLSTAPAYDAASGIWAWPAAHVDPSDERSWSELESVFGADAVADLRQAEGYLGMRVGIADDGTWVFAVAGD